MTVENKDPERKTGVKAASVLIVQHEIWEHSWDWVDQKIVEGCQNAARKALEGRFTAKVSASHLIITRHLSPTAKEPTPVSEARS